MSVAFMRPVEERDFAQIHALAQLTGGGMTNLPMDEDALRRRIDFTLESFAKKVTEPGGEVYLLVLEKDGVVIGTSAIFSSIGLQSGFVNYRINTMFHFSEQLGKRVSRRLLVPTHDFTGAAEVGSLFLDPSSQGGGFGKLLARSRYLFMAQSPEIFADRVCAELRGWREDNGEQPFWDAVGRYFFDMDFEAADQHNSIAGNQFIADLMPAYPLYIATLPEAAKACIGKPHRSAEPAFAMLEKEGFEYRGYVDIFDAGPVLDAKLSNLRAVRESTLSPVTVVDEIKQSAGLEPVLVATGKQSSYRCLRTFKTKSDNSVVLTKGQLEALQINASDQVRVTAW